MLYLGYKTCKYIRGSLKVASVTEKMRSDRLAWYGQLSILWERKNIMWRKGLNKETHKIRRKPKKILMDCVNGVRKYYRTFFCGKDITADGREWRKIHAVPTWRGIATERRNVSKHVFKLLCSKSQTNKIIYLQYYYIYLCVIRYLLYTEDSDGSG